ncbi:MAG: DUF2079 domain-containing protein [Bacteroidia bacterium]
MQKRQAIFPVIIVLVFAIIYSLVSFVNHYNLQTNAIDLGLYNNALYSYTHFKLNYSPLLEPLFPHRNQLADHFDIFLILISPLYHVFGSNTLLFIQIISVLIGGLGIYKFSKQYHKEKYIPALAMLHFFCMWGIFSALSFDYHSIVIAAMMIPWIYYLSNTDNRLFLIAVTTIAIICKENVALLLFMVFLGLMLLHYKNKKKLILMGVLAVCSLFYFYIVMKIIMPALLPSGVNYHHFEYSALGENFKEAFKTIITKPLYVFNLLFSDPDLQQITYGIKPETHFYVLFSGGFSFFLNPVLLFPALVIYAQKLFHNDFGKWGILVHYSIEFVPLIILSFYMWLSRFKTKIKYILSIVFISSSITLTVNLFYNPYSKWHNRRQLNLFDKNHYKIEFDAHKVIKLIKNVPKNLKVSSSTKLVPHLAFRDTIYQFPFYGNADLIILLKDFDDRFPVNEETFQQKIIDLQTDSNWVNCYNKNNLLVFKRKELDYCITDF